jgi:glycosyltransferase involved in cell wall biosynthesis
MTGLRIAYVTHLYFPSLGGVEYVVQNLAECLVLRGNDVTVITGEPGAYKTMVEEINGVNVIRIPTFAPGRSYHVAKDRSAITNSLKGELDIVHTHSVHAAISLIPLTMKRSSKVSWKLIITPHFSMPGYSPLTQLAWKLVWKRYVTSRLEQADLVHATSQLEASALSSYFPSVRERIATVPLGIKEDVLGYKWKGQDSSYLLYSGRLERYKRVDLLVRAVSYLVKHGHPLRLMVAGTGTFKRELVKVAESEFGPSADRFIFFDSPKPRNEYLELLCNARAAVSLSAFENFNLFLAEACAIGVPIVATSDAVAFCPELANVSVRSPDHVADVILTVLSASCPGHHECRVNTVQEMAREFEDVYKSLATEASRNPT